MMTTRSNAVPTSHQSECQSGAITTTRRWGVRNLITRSDIRGSFRIHCGTYLTNHFKRLAQMVIQIAYSHIRVRVACITSMVYIRMCMSVASSTLQLVAGCFLLLTSFIKFVCCCDGSLILSISNNTECTFVCLSKLTVRLFMSPILFDCPLSFAFYANCHLCCCIPCVPLYPYCRGTFSLASTSVSHSQSIQSVRVSSSKSHFQESQLTVECPNIYKTLWVR